MTSVKEDVGLPEVSRRSFLAGAAVGLAGVLGPFSVVACTKQEEETVLGAAASTDVPPTGIGSTGSRATLPAVNIKRVGDPAILNAAGQMDAVKFVTDLTKDELDAMLIDEAEVTEDFTTNSGKVVPAVYLALRNRINRIGMGIGAGVAGESEWDMLMSIWSEEDAAHELEMPLNKWFNATDYAFVSGRSEKESREICDSLADRALIWRIRRGGIPHYAVAPQLPGYWENHQLLLVARGEVEKAAKFAADCDLAFANGRQFATSIHRWVTHFFPIGKDVVKGEMFPYDDWEAMLQRHEVFSVMPCQCRQKRDLLGIRAEGCTEDVHPLETCTSYGELAQFYIEIGIARELTREEAIAQVKDNISHGLALEGPRSMAGGTFCACHHDCCLVMATINRSPEPPNIMPTISAYTLEYDKDACIKCYACVERCTMGALSTGEDGLVASNGFCISCGHCVKTCPAQARILVPKDVSETFEIQQDAFADSLELARIRMAQGRIRDFTGDIDAVFFEPEEIAAGK
ncbi:MAG: 4Fe-4S binding protein [Coriobacteriales bacterium]|jgi:ferredoxin|nr:4Fe-4S binding protein [Coriobacteriales bacterium]